MLGELCHCALHTPDDGQAVITGKLLLFLKDREKGERMGERTARGCAVEDVFERKHLLHARLSFLCTSYQNYTETAICLL